MPVDRFAGFSSPVLFGSLISSVRSLGALLVLLRRRISPISNAFIKIVAKVLCRSVLSACRRIADHPWRISLVAESSTLLRDLGSNH